MPDEKNSEQKPKRKFPELRLRGVSDKTKGQLENIAGNLGIDFDVFMKGKLAEIIMSYPEKMRQPPLNY